MHGGAFSMVCTVQVGSSDMDDTHVLLRGHAIYGENFQGQERCWADRQQLCRIAAVPEKCAEFMKSHGTLSFY